jgi:hypothetical protein
MAAVALFVKAQIPFGFLYSCYSVFNNFFFRGPVHHLESIFAKRSQVLWNA